MTWLNYVVDKSIVYVVHLYIVFLEQLIVNTCLILKSSYTVWGVDLQLRD